MLISGPSKCGKTVHVHKLLQHIDAMSTVPPREIIWYYSEYQPSYQQIAGLPRLRLVQGLPNMAELRTNTQEAKLIVLDDLMTSLKGADMEDLFTKGIHHWNTSCICIVQNLFHGGQRTSRINCHYLTLFKNPGDQLQVATLARQIYSGQSRYFIDAYRDATSQAHTYLFLDLSQDCPEELRLRTNIFPGEICMVYSH